MGDRSRITGTSPGEIVQWENEHGHTDPVMLMSRCVRPPRYFCLTHQRLLANRGQVEAHVETTGDASHQIATWCPTHGLEAFDAATIVAATGDGSGQLPLG